MNGAKQDASTQLSAADPADLPEIAALYNHEIRNGFALWNTAERSLSEMGVWFEERRAAGFPILTARLDGGFAGYGSFGSFRPHDGYVASVEHTVYVTPEARRRGVGRTLLSALEAEARRQGRHVMIGGIEAGNSGSLALHAGLGFVETARLPEIGRKFDRWLTLVMMQKILT